MCIIVVKRSGIRIGDDILRECFASNPDGAGFAVAKNGELRIRKGYFKFDEFSRAFKRFCAKRDSALLHFRIKTHGSVSKDNCHPYSVSDTVAMAHNGVLTDFRPDKDDDRSDTKVFVDAVIKKLPPNWEKNEGINALIRSSIGYSKLAFINSTGEFRIYNEKSGIWEDDIWFSNTSFRKIIYHAKPVTYSSGWKYTKPKDNILALPINDTNEKVNCDICGGKLYFTEELRFGICFKCTSSNIKKDREYCIGCGAELKKREIDRNFSYCDNCFPRFCELD